MSAGKLKLAKILLLTFAFLLALVLVEVMLRIFTPEPENLAKLRSSSIYIHENKKNATFNYDNVLDGFSNPITFNSYGFRDSEFQKEKEPGVFRIAVLGDSQVEALQVSLENTWQKVMAQRLSEELGRNVETYSFGVSGYGTDQQWLTLRDKVWPFSPDMVIVLFSLNDIGDVYKNKIVTLEGDRLKVSMVDRVGGNFLGKSVRETYTYHLIVKASSGNIMTKRFVDRIRVKILGFPKEERFVLSDSQLAQGPFEVIASQKNPPQEVLDTWNIEKALLADMQRQASDHKAKFLVAISIPRAQVSGDWDQLRDQYKLDPATSSDHEINDVLEGFGKERGITIYDGREDAIAWVKEKGIIHWKADSHYNINGNLFMGTKLADFIINQKLVSGE